MAKEDTRPAKARQNKGRVFHLIGAPREDEPITSEFRRPTSHLGQDDGGTVVRERARLTRFKEGPLRIGPIGQLRGVDNDLVVRALWKLRAGFA